MGEKDNVIVKLTVILLRFILPGHKYPAFFQFFAFQCPSTTGLSVQQNQLIIPGGPFSSHRLQ